MHALNTLITCKAFVICVPFTTKYTQYKILHWYYGYVVNHIKNILGVNKLYNSFFTPVKHTGIIWYLCEVDIVV